MDNEPLNINVRDAVLVIFIDFVLSSVLRVVTSTLVYFVCLFILFICSVLYVSAMASYRHEKEIQSVKRLFE